MHEISVGIRRYQPDDVHSSYEAALESTAAVYPWLNWCHPGYTLAEAQAWVDQCNENWETGRSFEFVIFDPETNRFLGGVGINQINFAHKFANMGYWVRSSATGRNIAVEATKMAARFAICQLGLTRVEIVVSVHNQRSLRVAEKIGATREGILRNRLHCHVQPEDAVMFSLIPEDFTKEAPDDESEADV